MRGRGHAATPAAPHGHSQQDQPAVQRLALLHDVILLQQLLKRELLLVEDLLRGGGGGGQRAQGWWCLDGGGRPRPSAPSGYGRGAAPTPWQAADSASPRSGTAARSQRPSRTWWWGRGRRTRRSPAWYAAAAFNRPPRPALTLAVGARAARLPAPPAAACTVALPPLHPLAVPPAAQRPAGRLL